MSMDRKQRVTLARVDDNKRVDKIAQARRYIYEENYGIDSVKVKRQLDEQSLVPTLVRDTLQYSLTTALI